MRAPLTPVLLLALAGACGDDDGGAAATVSATADPTTAAAGDSVTVTVTVTNFELVDPGSAPPNRDGEGHYHVYLDAATGPDYLVATATPSAVVEIPSGTAPGAHVLRVALMQNDHTPVPGAAEASVAITVSGPAPLLSVLIEPNPVSLNQDITITVTVENFVLDAAAIGGVPEAGHGHYHITIDGTYANLSAEPMSVWTVVSTDPPADGELRMPMGDHDVTVSLQNNDHSDLVPPLAVTTTLTVQ